VPQALEFHQLDRRLEHLRVRHPARHRRLLASLAETGQQVPIIVIAEAGGGYLVIDGYQRIAALQQLGRDTVNAVAWDMSEAEALVLARSLRINGEPETALEQGWLLTQMEKELGYSIEALARRFDRSPTWVARRLALVETLPEAVQQLVREGKIAAQIAMRCLAPVARVSVEQCLRMAQVFAQQHWTTRQAAAFYNAWRGAKGLARERILAQPGLFLKTQQQPPPPPAPTLESELNKIVAIAQRALQLELPPASSQTIRLKIQQATALLNQLTAQIEEQTTNHAEPGATHSDSGAARPGNQQARDRAPSEPVAAERPQGAAVELKRSAEDRTRRESGAAPPTDPGVIARLQGEPRASP
jgi:ParB family transcriptional regulator, chromosome partitioning protein